ncbi:hypothetical protein D3C84_512730 [compost metagenome]
MLATGGLDCLDEIFVVPGIDLARSSDVGRVRKHLFQLRHQWAIWALFKTGGENGRQLEELGNVSQGQHVVLELVGREILNQRNQAGLVVDQQHYCVVFVQAVVGSVAHDEVLSSGINGVVQHGLRLRM